jgi:poly(3-hydroxybutyrate) depolymerase
MAARRQRWTQYRLNVRSRSGSAIARPRIRRSLAILATMLASLSAAPPEAVAQTVDQLCSRGNLTAAVNGTITAETFSYGGTDRYLCTYIPSSLATGTAHPLLIALHGGSGNASQMMQDNHGIIAAAETMGAIAVFPNGLPRPSCAATLCLNNSWGEPDDVFFIAELIDRQKATGHVLDDRVHLIGFSGGAAQIYDIVATPGFPHAIHSVATVAGAFGLFSAGRADQGFTVMQIHEGTPVSALLVQGGSDPRLPAAGGLDVTGLEAHVSFRTKVDYWRLVTGTESAAAQPLDVLALDPNAPANLDAFSYDAGGPTVIEILDPDLGHAWPSWDVMAVAADLFQS